MGEVRKTKHRVTVAKATEEEFGLVWAFVRSMEALFDNRWGFTEEWWTWDEDDDDYRLLRVIQKELECEEEDGQVVLEFVRRKFRAANHSGSFGRILLDCETLIENCCDPTLAYLEFKPSIMYAERNALEKVEEIIGGGEREHLPAGEILARIRERIEESKKED